MTIRVHKIILLLLFVCIIALGAFFSTQWIGNWRVYMATQEGNRELKQELESLHREVNKHEAYLKRLLTDPVFFDSVVRQRLGYTREDEVVYRFEEEDLKQQLPSFNFNSM
tara:strand:- start:34577 stop:34909 length:333 start_codon:yes stop_codon:yes gene_type:complete